MSIPVTYERVPVRARPGMAYGQYNQISTYSTTAAGVTAGAVVSFSDGAVVNGGPVPCGVVVDSQSLLGLGFDDQYKGTCCAVLEQGKAWVLTKEGVTFSINDAVAYSASTGELDPAGIEIDGWTVVSATQDDKYGTRTLVQVLPTRRVVADAPAVEDPAPVQATRANTSKADKA